MALPDPTTITVGELRVVHHTVERLAARFLVTDPDHEIELSSTEHWIVLTLGEGRQYGFWRETMALYQADEHGAMGDEEVAL
jgi:hypothetical protein